jgi:hypothetical protein
MKFKLPDFDTTNFPKAYVGHRLRIATATDVHFVSDTKILVASLANKKIYFIDITNEIKIIDEIDTPNYPDLIDYKNGDIITANNPIFKLGETHGSISLFQLINDKLFFKKNIILENIKPHSCNFLDKDNVIVCNVGDNKTGCLILNLNEEKYTIFNNFKNYPKDTYITENNILLITSGKASPNIKNENITSNLYLYDKNYLKLDEIEILGQIDGITLNGENGFVTLQNEDAILYFKLLNNKFEVIKKINGFDFPHGISSLNDKIIVTNYGDNSIDILNISDLIY